MERFSRSRVKSYEGRGRFAASPPASPTLASEGPMLDASLNGSFKVADSTINKIACGISEPGATSPPASLPFAGVCPEPSS